MAFGKKPTAGKGWHCVKWAKKRKMKSATSKQGTYRAKFAAAAAACRGLKGKKRKSCFANVMSNVRIVTKGHKAKRSKRSWPRR